MKIILIAYAFPPFPVVGSFRAANVAESLRAAGHDVRVITVRLSGESDRIRVSEPGFRVEAVRALPGPFQLYRAAKKIFGGVPAESDGGSPDATGPDPHVTAEQIPLWKRYILSTLAVPDIHQGFVIPALAGAMRASRGGADLIYTTAPPFSVHLVGLAMKRLRGTRWVAEFRDPWTGNPARLPHLRSRGADAANRWLEQRCLARADQVVTVSEAVYRQMHEKMDPDRPDRVVLVRNGIDEFRPFQNGQGGGGPFRIVYTGAIPHNYDPRPFLRGLAALRDARQLSARDLHVQFVGRCRWYGDILLEKMVRDLHLDEIVEFSDWMPRADCRKIQREADLLLLLAQGRPAQVPNKLYDYLGMRKPILAFAMDESESAQMLRRVGGHYIVTDSELSSARCALEAAMDAHEAGIRFECDESLLEEWSTARQMEHLRAAVGI